MPEGQAFGDWRVEQGNDGSCRGKVWIYNDVTKRMSELHFDAASWADLRHPMAGVERMIAKETSRMVIAGPDISKAAMLGVRKQ